MNIGHPFGCLLCPYEPLRSGWADFGVLEILSYRSICCIFKTDAIPSDALEFDDPIVVPKNCVNLGFDIKACSLFATWILILQVFEKCVLVGKAQETIKAGSNDLLDTRWVITFDFDSQFGRHYGSFQEENRGRSLHIIVSFAQN